MLAGLVLVQEPNMGVYVDFVHSFSPGEKIEAEQNRIENVLGKPKSNLYSSLSLGHRGEVIVGYTNGYKKAETVKCFDNKEGYDIYVHEPHIPANKQESVEVYISEDRELKPSSKWHFIGKKDVNEGIDGWMGFDMGDTKKAYWVKLKDGNSRLIDSIFYSGFEASSVKLKYPCRYMLMEKKKTKNFAKRR